MKTYSLKAKTHTPRWLVIDADGQTLGRLASTVATYLSGKHYPHYTPHMLSGDVVIVINSDKITVTGNKLATKKYYRHSGYPGGLSETTLREQLDRDSTKVVIAAVKGMLPKNKLAADMLKNLKVFVGTEHPHTAQQPEEVKVRS